MKTLELRTIEKGITTIHNKDDLVLVELIKSEITKSYVVSNPMGNKPNHDYLSIVSDELKGYGYRSVIAIKLLRKILNHVPSIAEIVKAIYAQEFEDFFAKLLSGEFRHDPEIYTAEQSIGRCRLNDRDTDRKWLKKDAFDVFLQIKEGKLKAEGPSDTQVFERSVRFSGNEYRPNTTPQKLFSDHGYERVQSNLSIEEFQQEMDIIRKTLGR